jgi:hypothetical protein
MNTSDGEIDWSVTTWEGSRRAQLRAWMKLSLAEKWQAVEEMADWGRATIQWRRARGLPYIDPYTGARVPGTTAREEPPTAPNPENS